MTDNGDKLYADIRLWATENKLYRLTGEMASHREQLITHFNVVLADARRGALEEAVEILEGNKYSNVDPQSVDDAHFQKHNDEMDSMITAIRQRASEPIQGE